MRPEDASKVTDLVGRLRDAIRLRARLLAADSLELVVGTGGTSQSIKLSAEFDHLVRARLIAEMEDEARVHAATLHELGINVELSF